MQRFDGIQLYNFRTGFRFGKGTRNYKKYAGYTCSRRQKTCWVAYKSRFLIMCKAWIVVFIEAVYYQSCYLQILFTLVAISLERFKQKSWTVSTILQCFLCTFPWIWPKVAWLIFFFQVIKFILTIWKNAINTFTVL